MAVNLTGRYICDRICHYNYTFRDQETQQNEMRISAYFPDRELESENVTFNNGFNGEYEKRMKTLNATLTSK